MKIAFIVQRYGTEILGGSEYHCRLVAERLTARHHVEVLTTCAREYTTWANEYPEGADRVRGVTVRRFATSRTRDLPEVCRRAEVLVAAVGSPGLVTGDMVGEGAVVIDVGTNRTEDGLVGDVDFEAAKERARAITPVPGGVGPMTRAMLLVNTLKAARARGG